MERRAQFVVPDDHPSLAGHFPGDPIVPGVVLLDLVANAIGGPQAKVRAIPSVKFLTLLRPGQEVAVVWEETGNGVRFRCEVGATCIAMGLLKLEAAQSA